jgi:aryl-alcohol dehydrogenase-like predicted oxidoreductase
MASNPRFSLGTVQWGMDYGISNTNGIPDDLELGQMLEWALKNGIKHLDTARSYADSEARIGRLVIQKNLKFHITTKVDISNEILDSNRQKIENAVHNSISESLRQLGVKRLDNVLLHRGEIAIRGEMIAWETLREFKQNGKIGRIGFSARNPEEANLAFKLPECGVVQVASSLLDQRLSRQGYFEKCRDLLIETHVRSTFLQGVAFMDSSQLTGKLKELAPTLDNIRYFANQSGIPTTELWKKYAQELNADFLIIGVTNKRELVESVRQLSPEKNHKAIDDFIQNLPSHSDEVLDPSYWGPEESERLFKRVNPQFYPQS